MFQKWFFLKHRSCIGFMQVKIRKTDFDASYTAHDSKLVISYFVFIGTNKAEFS